MHQEGPDSELYQEHPQGGLVCPLPAQQEPLQTFLHGLPDHLEHHVVGMEMVKRDDAIIYRHDTAKDNPEVGDDDTGDTLLNMVMRPAYTMQESEFPGKND